MSAVPFDFGMENEIRKIGFHPFIAVRWKRHVFSDRYIVCETQNEIAEFVTKLQKCPGFDDCHLLRALVCAVLHDTKGAVEEFRAWVRIAPAGVTETIFVGLAQGQTVPGFYHYPMIEAGSVSKPSSERAAVDALTDMLNAYVIADGNDHSRFALIDALVLMLVEYQTEGLSDTQRFINIVTKAFGKRPDAEILQAARTRLVGSEDSLNEQPTEGLSLAEGLLKPVEKRRLKIVVVGTGRDGTLSLTRMMQDLYDVEGLSGRVAHEYAAREFYEAYCNLVETGDPKYKAEIDALVAACDFDCIVGNGYAPILSAFVDHYGDELQVVHLKRDDREACLSSLVRNAEYFPESYKYYSDSPKATSKRVAAFHFDEMNQETWQAKPIREKFAWYYDKTHQLLDDYAGVIGNVVNIATEDLVLEKTRRQISRLVLQRDDVLPPAVKLNAHLLDIADFDVARRAKMQWLLGRLDFERLAHDDTYAVEYMNEKLISWLGYQISGDIVAISPDDVKSPEEIELILDQAHRNLSQTITGIEALKSLLLAHKKSKT